MAKPRVFLSSTYKDLKHVRERIERFLTNFGMESVLFESDNVTFEFNKPLDLSCYNEVKNCHMMVLVVGGRYGSAATGEKVTPEKKDLYEQYVSITRKEHETATETGIPSFVFIEKNVYAEYQTYKKNKKIFDDKIPFNFAHVDDINIFKFVSTLEQTTAIKTFDKVEEIESYLENQLSGMLFTYLKQLQTQTQERKMLDSIAELNSISQRMNEMVTAIGKTILNSSDEYEGVIENQNNMLITFFKDMFYDNINFNKEPTYKQNECDNIIDHILSILFVKDSVEQLIKVNNKRFGEKLESLKERLDFELGLTDHPIIINKINLRKIMLNYTNNIYPIIEERPYLFDKMKNIFHENSLEAITGFPF